MSTLFTLLLCSASSMFQSENASCVVLVGCVSWHLVQYLIIPGTEQVLPSLTQQKSFQESSVDFVYSSSLFTVLLCLQFFFAPLVPLFIIHWDSGSLRMLC